MDNKEKKSFLNAEQASAIAKYSGMAFQMAIIIVIGVVGGQKLDEWLNTEPVLALICSLLSIFAAIYFPLKDFINPKKKG